MNAPRGAVYRALLDPQAVAIWMVPTGMTSQVHRFEPREGGSFRISLRYVEPSGTGKTTAIPIPTTATSCGWYRTSW